MSVLCIGVGGSGMRGIAYLLEQKGEHIIGYDDNPQGTRCSMKDALSAIPTCEYLVYSDAVPADHPLRIAARSVGLREVAYQQAVGEFSSAYTTIAITGTHGKSSTTAFLAHIAIEAGLDPTVLVGADMPTLPGGHARLGKSKYFIAEADEYRRHFLELTPTHIVITSVGFDHPDAFSSLKDSEHTYTEFIARLQPNGKVITPLYERLNHPHVKWPSDTITIQEDDTQDITVSLPGNHMRMNAALACEAALLLGISRADSKRILATFPGLSRRFELVGLYNGIEIRSDYGHHPTEITATIAGARQVQPHAHIVAIFEAHMPLRLHTFLDDFAASLATADSVIIVPPFAPIGRDTTDSKRDAHRLQDMIIAQGKPVTYAGHISELPDVIKHHQALGGGHVLAIGFSAGSLDLELRKIVNSH